LAEQALLSRQRALIANEVLDGTRKDLRIITEELKISQNTANILTKKCADQSNDLKTLQATLKGTERNLKKTEKELNGWKKEAEQLQQINEELEAELEAANSGDVGGKEDSYEIEDSTIKNIKVTVQKVFRMIKFVSTDAQLEKFGDMVMDNLGISQLKKPDGVVAPDAKALANVRRNRVAFRNTYCKFWNRYLNESRTTAQVFDL
jgi:chromosome segregation ATPase